MKQTIALIALTVCILSSPISTFAQKNFQWEGRWEFIISNQSFCNIHIVTDLWGAQEAPTAIIEGLIDGNPFRVKCKVQKLPQRNSLIFYEDVEEGNKKQYNKGETLLILTVAKERGHSKITPIWGQINITKNEVNKICTIKKIPTPRYTGTYTLYYKETEASFVISKPLPSLRIPSDPLYNKISFHANLETSQTTLNCDCSLITTHLAICYPKKEEGTFYIEFNETGIKLIKNYEDDIYNTKLIKSRSGGVLVLHTTFKK